MINPVFCRSFVVFMFTCVTAIASVDAFASKNFPRPPELERDVAFWLRVYTEVDTKSGFIHDSVNLSVVYDKLELTGDGRLDERTIANAKSKYVTILQQLASNREGLNAEQQKVLRQWGSKVSNAQLRAAATNLRFQRGQSDRFREGIARSGQWYSYIETVLAQHKLPPELAALPHVESSFNPEAYSSAGAAGIWQFTRPTGRRYLHIDYVVDERMDPYAATVGAVQLLAHNYQLTGTWPLALTAYNHGASGMRRAIKQLGTSDIDRVVREYKGPTFGFASRNFYVSFLAALEASEHPERYFASVVREPAVQYANVEVEDFLLVDTFARAFNTDLAELKSHNRALLDPVWQGKKRIPKGFNMRVPAKNLAKPAAQLLAAIPADQRFGEQTPDVQHKVVPGDTVSEIASRYRLSVKEVAAMNGLNSGYQIRVGQVLRLPLEGSVATATVNVEAPPAAQQLSMAATKDNETDTATADAGVTALPAVVDVEAQLSADPADYTVAADNSIEIQAAETLGHYAEWLDVRSSELRARNGMSYGSDLVIGNRLKMDFSRVDKAGFERRRLAYQYELQQNFFMVWQIQGTRQHVIASGDSLWLLTRRDFKIPMWLLRQYNPDLDFDRLKLGTVIVIPELAAA